MVYSLSSHHMKRQSSAARASWLNARVYEASSCRYGRLAWMASWYCPSSPSAASAQLALMGSRCSRSLHALALAALSDEMSALCSAGG